MKRSKSKPPIEIRKFTSEEIELGIKKLRRRIEEIQNLDPNSVPYDDAKVNMLESKINMTIQDVFGLNSQEFRDYGYHRIWHGGYNTMDTDAQRQAKFAAGIPQTITMLEGLISHLEEKHEDLIYDQKPEQIPQSDPLKKSRKVFIIHGHDELNLMRLDNLLQDRFYLDTIILKEKPGKGRTLIEKFEQEAPKASYAFVIFTPDDLIEVKKTKYTQARPNVIFELGWFYGRLRRERVCILFKKGTKIPSDLEGITRVEFENSIEEKVIDIENELKEAGLL